MLVYEIASPIFFAAVENFERALLETHTLPRMLVLRLDRAPFMDITGIQTLEEVMAELHKRGVKVILCEGNERALGKLLNAAVLTGADDRTHQDLPRDALLEAGVRTERVGHGTGGARRVSGVSRSRLSQWTSLSTSAVRPPP